MRKHSRNAGYRPLLLLRLLSLLWLKRTLLPLLSTTPPSVQNIQRAPPRACLPLELMKRSQTIIFYRSYLNSSCQHGKIFQFTNIGLRYKKKNEKNCINTILEVWKRYITRSVKPWRIRYCCTSRFTAGSNNFYYLLEFKIMWKLVNRHASFLIASRLWVPSVNHCFNVFK